MHDLRRAGHQLDHDAIDAAFEGQADSTGEGDATRALFGAEVSRQLHARWMDEQIPALDGLTPRQAAADPTRREQLERLLEEYDVMGEQLGRVLAETDGFATPFTYDTDALRRELGLA